MIFIAIFLVFRFDQSSFRHHFSALFENDFTAIRYILVHRRHHVGRNNVFLSHMESDLSLDYIADDRIHVFVVLSGRFTAMAYQEG